MKKFDESRTQEERQFIDNLHKSIKPELTFDQLMKQREEEENNIEIPMIEGLDPKNLDMNLFNQIFNANTKKHNNGLEPIGNPGAMGRTGLAPIDNYFGQGSLFANDPWMDYQSHM